MRKAIIRFCLCSCIVKVLSGQEVILSSIPLTRSSKEASTSSTQDIKSILEQMRSVQYFVKLQVRKENKKDKVVNVVLFSKITNLVFEYIFPAKSLGFLEPKTAEGKNYSVLCHYTGLKPKFNLTKSNLHIVLLDDRFRGPYGNDASFAMILKFKAVRPELIFQNTTQLPNQYKEVSSDDIHYMQILSPSVSVDGKLISETNYKAYIQPSEPFILGPKPLVKKIMKKFEEWKRIKYHGINYYRVIEKPRRSITRFFRKKKVVNDKDMIIEFKIGPHTFKMTHKNYTYGNKMFRFAGHNHDMWIFGQAFIEAFPLAFVRTEAGRKLYLDANQEPSN